MSTDRHGMESPPEAAPKGLHGICFNCLRETHEGVSVIRVVMCPKCAVAFGAGPLAVENRV